MVAITKTDKRKNVAKRWAFQYPSANRPEGKEKIFQQLLELKGRGTDNEIAAIIGNSSWTENKCSECGKDSETLIQLGEKPDYESVTAWICLTCLKTAVRLARVTGKQRAQHTT